MQPAGREDLADPRRPERIRPGMVLRLGVGIIRREEVIVRSCEVPLFRIDNVWKRLDREIAVPLVAAVTGNGDEAAEVASNRRDRDRLIADRPRDICPHHVLRRDAAVAASFPELIPALRLIDLHPRSTKRVRLVMLLVFGQDRPVARELQVDTDRRFPFDLDGVLDHPHVFPRASVLVLIRVGWVRVVDVEILAIGAENRQPPCTDLVVPDRHAGQHRLTAADYVPSRGHQM